jgi:dihydrofolate reductase
MTRVIWTVMSSLDGRAAAPGEGFETIAWFRADEEWLDYSVELLDEADTILFGRTTFDGMESYWPTADGPVAERMNGRAKIAFSRSPRATGWAGARMSADPVGEVAALRHGTERDAVVMGSATLAGTLVAHGLVDEVRVAINPVLLGDGTPLLAPGGGRVDLDLTSTRTFGSGIVELRYTPATRPGPGRSGPADR